MTPEELLRPRYKVIADYPESEFTIGMVLTKSVHNDWCFNAEKEVGLPYNQLDKYPHLFKKLEWWEERTEKDIPYVKTNPEKVDGYRVYKVKKIERHFDSGYAHIHYKGGIGLSMNYIPATEEEFNNQPIK